MDAHLTDREWTVWWLIYKGLSNKEIARELGIANLTVKNHVAALLTKCHFNDRLEAGLRMFEELYCDGQSKIPFKTQRRQETPAWEW